MSLTKWDKNVAENDDESLLDSKRRETEMVKRLEEAGYPQWKIEKAKKFKVWYLSREFMKQAKHNEMPWSLEYLLTTVLSEKNQFPKKWEYPLLTYEYKVYRVNSRHPEPSNLLTIEAHNSKEAKEEIHKLLQKCSEGYDLVSGWRKYRKDSKLFINLPSKLFNFLAGTFWGLKLKDYNCGLKLYTKDAAKSLNLYGGRQRFIPLLLYQNGFKVTEVPVEHEKRLYGKSKYGPSKSLKEFPDMFTMIFLTKYAKSPLHFFGYIGSVISGIGILILLYLSALHFLGQSIGTRPLLTLGMLLVLAGFQILLTGFLADLILHITQKDKNENSFESELKYKTE